VFRVPIAGLLLGRRDRRWSLRSLHPEVSDAGQGRPSISRFNARGIASASEKLYDRERIGAAAYRPNPEAKSASLSRAADLHLDREPVDHESHDENHILILLSAS